MTGRAAVARSEAVRREMKKDTPNERPPRCHEMYKTRRVEDLEGNCFLDGA